MPNCLYLQPQTEPVQRGGWGSRAGGVQKKWRTEGAQSKEFAYFWYRATGSQADMKQEENKEYSAAREAGGRTAGPRRFTPERITSLAPGEVFVFGMHISFFASTNPHFRPDEKRARKLLLHRKEIDKWHGRVAQDGLSVVPLMIYFNKNNRVKLQIALVRGKKLHDKRESIKKRILDREARASLKDFGKHL